jgi:signal transduction histidine kinase
MRLLPHSIQGRMLALSAIATLAALALAGLLIAGILARTVTQGIDRRLDAELALLASAIANDGSIDRARLVRLRGALEAGPGWRWQIQTPTARFGSRDLPLMEGAPRHHLRERDGHGPRPLDGRDRGGQQMHARELRVQTDSGAVVLTSAAPRAVIERPVREALVPLLVTLGLLGAGLGIAVVAQVRLGLRPLRRLRDAVVAIRTGAARTIDEEQPSELRPLVAELNVLIGENDATLAAARASAANLAHALKTPVATLALELRDDPRAPQVDRIAATIRHHLARARLNAVSTRTVTTLDTAVAALGQTIQRIHVDRRIVIDVEVAPGLAITIDSADLDELVGNLIDNATRHARSRVSVSGHAEGRMARLTVRDDGKGIAIEDRARATEPGVRLDERGDGHGFGLAIARELASLHGGVLTLGEAAEGGLQASVTLPLAAPAA